MARFSGEPEADLDGTAKEAALYRLASAHDRFIETEQMYLAAGREAEAAGAHRYAMWCHRAYVAEAKNPVPS